MHWETKKDRASFATEIPLTFVLSAITLLCSSYGTTATSKKTTIADFACSRVI